MTDRFKPQERACIYFGKYRGKPYDSLPTPYLLWLKNNLPFHGITRQAWREIDAVLKTRTR